MYTQFLLFLALISAINGAKILGVFAMPSPSHYILESALMRALAEKGHDVTVISPYGEKNPPKNGTYRDIILTGAVEEKNAQMERLNINMFDREKVNPYISVALMSMVMIDYHEKVLAHENVQKLMKSGETFDVVIVEQFVNDALKALSTHFKASLITFSTLGYNFWTNSISGNPSPPSFVPEVLLNLGTPMSFLDRLNNSFFVLFNYALSYLYVFPRQNEIVKKYFPEGPDFYDVLYNSSVVLLNSHLSVKQAVPMVPNMIEIGGFHIEPPKKLPKDLQEFLDSAKDGAIYFSMGSNLNSADLPVEKRDALISAFAKLKQKVLWKWEDDKLPNKPDNVMLRKWLPQQDILAHPNVKLFITHVGLLSVTETIYHGVPILAIPIFGDQKLNAQSAVNNGIGLSLPYTELTEEKLTKYLDELLNNPKYKNNAKVRSKIFHDRPMKPIDLAIYWVEYVIRHRGARHIRVGALDIPWYQYYMLDVIGLPIVVGLATIAVGFRMLRRR